MWSLSVLGNNRKHCQPVRYTINGTFISLTFDAGRGEIVLENIRVLILKVENPSTLLNTLDFKRRVVVSMNRVAE